MRPKLNRERLSQTASGLFPAWLPRPYDPRAVSSPIASSYGRVPHLRRGYDL